MNRRRHLWVMIVLLLAGYTNGLNAQPVYVNTEEGIFQLNNGANSVPVLVNNGCGDDNDILSIAVYKDTIYYNTWGGALKRFKAGTTGSCETLIESGFSYNSMTVDKNGIIYMATEILARYNPYTRQLKELGRLPFFSAGDMLFYHDKLLLAGWDPTDWSTGIFELNVNDLAASKLYMPSPSFFGLLSFPVECGNSRYFGLAPGGDQTELIEIDLDRRTIAPHGTFIQKRILDAASSTETGIDRKVSLTSIAITAPTNCMGDNGSFALSAFSPNGPVNYTLLSTGMRQATGQFTQLSGGRYDIRVKDISGCSVDTTIVIPQSIPLPGCNDLYIPTAFTPNNDGKNDLFTISIPPAYKDIRLQVFNRWGNIVYQASGNRNGWDGYSKGSSQPTGIYIYTLTFVDASGQKQQLKGTLTLIR